MSRTKITKKIIALYIRVSTDEQAQKGNSLIEQEERLRAYCQAMEIQGEIKVYRDDGYSAGSMRRPSLTEMMKDIRAGKVQMVAITKIDRLCRNLKDLLDLVDEFDQMNCGFASASERFDTSTAAGRMVLQILGAFAEFERARNSERVKDNMMSIVKNTDKAVSRPCFGYDVIDKKYAINEEEAEIVRKMVDWMIQGEGAHRVMRRLNRMGIKTKDGNSFTQRAVGKLMKRETITGTFVYNRGYYKNGKYIIRPKEEWVIHENHHPAIIDMETFDRLQLTIDARKTSGKQADNERWLLTGLVRCTHCGALMYGRHKKKPSGREYFHYVCSSYMRKHECFHHFIDRDMLENAVIDYLKKAEYLQNINDRVQESVDKDDPDLNLDLLYDRLNKLDIKMQRQIELFEDADITKEDFRRARDRIDGERQEITKLIAIAEGKELAAAEEKFIKLANDLKDDINSDNREKKKNALRLLIKSVEVTNASSIHIQILL